MKTETRVVAWLLVAILGLSAGCRRTLSPAVGAGPAPETWITAAATDTLSLGDPDATPAAGLHRVAQGYSRARVDWAGSSRDDSITGFYWALVEAGGGPGDDAISASLPQPGPGDYRFTTRTDTTFVLPLDAGPTPRRRVFYVYAVDAKGRVDRTAASVVLEGRGGLGQRPLVLDATAVGTIVTLGPFFRPVVHPRQEYPLTVDPPAAFPPADTVPAFSWLHLRWWRGGGRTALLPVVMAGEGDASGAVAEDAAARPDGPGGAGRDSTVLLTPGMKVMTVPAPPEAGGGTRTLRFMVNFSPDTWWAGPDPALWPPSTDGEGARAVDVADWSRFATSPAWPPDGRPYFGPDSFRYLPSVRRPLAGDFRRGTFYEIYGNRIYARSEGDTVHMNSWLVLYNGGYDPDSRYLPRVDPTDPALPAGFAGDPGRFPVLDDRGLVGSPIGFRSWVPMRLTPTGIRLWPAQTSLYPVFEPASVFRSPRLAGYWRSLFAGRAYALARAEDADGGLDHRITDPVALADLVDGGGGTVEERALRRNVLVYYVDKAPALVRGASQLPPGTLAANGVALDLAGMDLDPFDPPIGNIPGGPTPTAVLRFKVTVKGPGILGPAGRDTSWTYTNPATRSPYLRTTGRTGPFTLTLGGASGSPFASGRLTFTIQTCDCNECENVPGQGRCVEDTFEVQYTRPGASSAATGS